MKQNKFFMDTLTDITSDKYINVLRVYGTYDEITKFFNYGFDYDKSNQFSFKKFIPDNISTNDYERLVWCLENYGTLTDCFETKVDDYATDWLGVSFLTCGGVPIKFVEQLSKMYPNVVVELLYSNNKLLDEGKIVFKNGEITVQRYEYANTIPHNSLWNEYYDIRIAKEQLLKQIDEDLRLSEENSNHTNNQK